MLGDEPMSNDLTEYFAGTKLYGDDFSTKDIEAWFKDETDAYAELGAKDRSTYHYAYTALNEHHGYRFLPPAPSSTRSAWAAPTATSSFPSPTGCGGSRSSIRQIRSRRTTSPASRAGT